MRNNKDSLDDEKYSFPQSRKQENLSHQFSLQISNQTNFSISALLKKANIDSWRDLERTLQNAKKNPEATAAVLDLMLQSPLKLISFLQSNPSLLVPLLSTNTQLSEALSRLLQNNPEFVGYLLEKLEKNQKRIIAEAQKNLPSHDLRVASISTPSFSDNHPVATKRLFIGGAAAVTALLSSTIGTGIASYLGNISATGGWGKALSLSSTLVSTPLLAAGAGAGFGLICLKIWKFLNKSIEIPPSKLEQLNLQDFVNQILPLEPIITAVPIGINLKLETSQSKASSNESFDQSIAPSINKTSVRRKKKRN
jgi:hypothetical protein